MNSRQMRLVGAAFGAGTVLAMGALTVSAGETGESRLAPVPGASEVTLGETTTKRTGARSAPETSVAVPPITTAPFTIPTGEVQ